MNDSIENYNPNSVAEKNGNFMGLPFNYDSANLIIFPIPWEVTVSYRAGTANGPQQILDASRQIDLFDLAFRDSTTTILPLGRQDVSQPISPLEDYNNLPHLD